MEISKPNANSNNIDTFLNMTTPSKSVSKSSSIRQSMNKNNTTQHQTPSNNNNNNNNNYSSSLNSSTIIPSNIMQSPAPNKNSAYKSRKRKGQIVCSLNNDLTKRRKCDNININIIQKNDNKDIMNNKHYRFMYQDIFSKQKVIKERITYIGNELIKEIRDEQKNEDKNEEKEKENIVYSPIDEPSQRSCYFLGRIMNDGDNAGSDKITAGNIILEGDMEISFGKRVKLDLSALESISLFPGQIVAIKGINSSGKEINVEKIYQKSYLRENKIKMMNNNYGNNKNDDTLEIMVASGPFTFKNSLDFNNSPFYDFAKLVVQNEPNCVILMGPFTDIDNEQIRNNEINITFDELFKHLLSSFIKYIDGHYDKIIIIPSTRDVHHFSAFPQERYMINNVNNDNIIFVSNPSEFNINNVSFGICSADFIFNCCKIGLTKNIPDRLLSIMSHCINQQNFYPLQPSSTALRMDYTKYKHLEMANKLDIFIMPSTLKQFVKTYNESNTVCINPSFLTKGNSGGTFAKIQINKSNDYHVNDYSDFIQVDILRI